MNEPLYVKRAEAAKMLSIHPNTLDRYVKAGLVPSFQPAEGKSAARLFAVADLKQLTARWAQPRIPSEIGSLFVDPARNLMEQRHVRPEREDCERMFRVMHRTPMVLTDLGIEVRIARDAVRPPERGTLWAVSLAEPTDTAGFRVGDKTVHGVAFLAGRLPDAPEPNPAAREWGLLDLVDVREVSALVSFAATENKAASAGEVANG